jgi:thiamine kinase-like enzyme
VQVDEIPLITARIAALVGDHAGEAVPLAGGITNRNYKVPFGDHDFVVRVPGKDTNLLGIDRDAECEANKLAAEVGVAPPVVLMLEDPQVIVTKFVEAEEMSEEDLRQPEAIQRVAAALRKVHDSGRELASRFDSFEIVETYAETARQRGVTPPDEYGDALSRAREIKKALTHAEHEPVPCHNDLLAANFLNDGTRIHIVDWEYAGMGDRYFDLGNYAVNNELDEDRERALLKAYFGEPADARRYASLRLMRFMSDFREAMWGVVQTGISELDFDFEGYAAKHFGRLSEAGADPRFEEWLREADASAA